MDQPSITTQKSTLVLPFRLSITSRVVSVYESIDKVNKSFKESHDKKFFRVKLSPIRWLQVYLFPSQAVIMILQK